MDIARTTANALTLSRGALAPLILIALAGDVGGGAGLALVLTGVAVVTDYLDGAVARRFAVVSRFGKVADALTDAMVFVAIFAGLGVRGVLPPWVPALIAAREAAMYGLIRPALLRLRIDAGARPVGKLKTVLQAGAAIVVLVVLLVEPEHARRVAVPLVGAAAVLSIVSLYWYVDPIGTRRGWDGLTLSIIATCLSLWLLQMAIVAVAADLGVTAGVIPYVAAEHDGGRRADFPAPEAPMRLRAPRRAGAVENQPLERAHARAADLDPHRGPAHHCRGRRAPLRYGR